MEVVTLILDRPRHGQYLKHVLNFSIAGFGVGLASSSSFVSLNHYFSKKRGQAVGLSMAGTGFGLMVMPQLVNLLLSEYGFRWTVVILGALAFHAILGSCLLQPVKRHLIEEPVDCEMQTVKVTITTSYITVHCSNLFLLQLYCKHILISFCVYF